MVQTAVWFKLFSEMVVVDFHHELGVPIIIYKSQPSIDWTGWFFSARAPRLTAFFLLPRVHFSRYVYNSELSDGFLPSPRPRQAISAINTPLSMMSDQYTCLPSDAHIFTLNILP